MDQTSTNNYRVIINQITYDVEDVNPTEAATKVVEKLYKDARGATLVPIAILIQDKANDHLPVKEQEDLTAVVYSPVIFANAGLYNLAEKIKAAIQI